MHRKKLLIKRTLLTINAIALFAIAYLVGGKIAAAQVKYFDEPVADVVPTRTLSDQELETLRKRPATAQYGEFKDQVYSTVTPENPGANEEVSIQVEVYSYDINSAEIIWKLNGKIADRGLGKKTFKFKTGNPGETTKVEVSIDPRDRPVTVQNFSFTPGEVDLLWEADVYAHPFYKGKKFYTPESNITLVAMPRNGKGLVRPSETVFNWRINGTNDAENSGFGKNTYQFEGPIILKPLEAEVETYTPTPGAGDTKAIARSEITVNPFSAGIRLYENHPRYGILFNRALFNQIEINKDDLGIAAYPYFQSIKNKNSDTIYTWLIDDIPLELSPVQNMVALKRVEADSGSSFIQVQSQTPAKILQTTDTGLNISFSKRNNSNQSQQFGQE